MDTDKTRRLIKTMLDSGKLTPETREEFKEHLEELEKGTLDTMDADYVHSLAQRLGFAGGGAKSGGATTAANDDDDVEDDDWPADDDDDDFDDGADEAAREEIAALQSQIETARAAVDKARYWVTQLERVPQGDGGTASSNELDMVESLKSELDDAATALSERQ